MEKWKNARLRCSDQRRFQGLRSERAELWPETDSVEAISSGPSQSTHHPPMPTCSPPAPPDTTTTTTSPSPTRSSPTPTTQPDTNNATPRTHERLQFEQLNRQQRLEGILHFRDMWRLDDTDSGGINPWHTRLSHVVPIVPVAPCARMPNLSDFGTNPLVGNTEAGEICWQVASGNNTDSVLAKDGDTALLQQLSTDPATLAAANIINLYGDGAATGPGYVTVTSTSSHTHSTRILTQRVRLRRRLWRVSWPLRTDPSHDE
jgi:hypothetical protein